MIVINLENSKTITMLSNFLESILWLIESKSLAKSIYTAMHL